MNERNIGVGKVLSTLCSSHTLECIVIYEYVIYMYVVVFVGSKRFYLNFQIGCDSVRELWKKETDDPVISSTNGGVTVSYNYVVFNACVVDARQ